MFVLQPVIALQEATKLSSSNIFIVMNSLSILIVKGLLGLTEGMKKHLTNEGFHVYETSGMLEAISVLNRSGINILLVELDNSHGNRWNFIQSIIKKHPDLEEFIQSDTTALIAVEATRCVHVGKFQTISVWDCRCAEHRLL